MVNDILYDRSAWKDVKEAFPNASLTDASDYIHIGRFQVQLEIPLEDWYVWLLENGWYNISISFKRDVMLAHKHESRERIEQALAKVERKPK